jgi:hypothetical protein
MNTINGEIEATMQQEVAEVVADLKYREMEKWIKTNFSILTCQQVYDKLINDPTQTNEEKLNVIREHKQRTRQVCTEFASMQRSATSIKEVQIMLKLAQVTVSQMRIQFANTLDMYTQGGSTDDKNADSMTVSRDECITHMSQNCTALYKLERELTERIGNRASQWNVTRLLSIAKQGTSFILDVLSKTGEVTKLVFNNLAHLASYLMPMVAKLILFTLHSPRAALMALLYVKHLKRSLCRNFVGWLINSNIDLPPTTTSQNLCYYINQLKTSTTTIASNVGPAIMIRSLGGAVEKVFLSTSQPLGALITVAFLPIPVFGPVLGPLLGGICQAAFSVTGEVLREAAEFAAHKQLVDNTFYQFFELIQISDCLSMYYAQVALNSRIVAAPEQKSFGSPSGRPKRRCGRPPITATRCPPTRTFKSKSNNGQSNEQPPITTPPTKTKLKRNGKQRSTQPPVTAMHCHPIKSTSTQRPRPRRGRQAARK